MKNFEQEIKEKDQKLNNFYSNKELENIEDLIIDLEKELQQIDDNLKDTNYLLDLIEKHHIEESATPNNQKIDNRKNWLAEKKVAFEKFHLRHTKELSPKDIKFLQTEKSKLVLEKKQLDEEHKHVNLLIAKANVKLSETRNVVCKEITKGHDIAAVGEKLIEHFKNKISEETTYESGRKTILKFLEEFFSIDKIQSRNLFDILEKSKLVNYKVDIKDIVEFPDYEDFSDTGYIDYPPIFGTWSINA